MSTLKFWNKQNNSSNTANQNGGSGGVVENLKTGSGGRNWLHQPDALTNGHVAYLVKYLGNTPVDQPKGIEVVKEAIRKLQFTQQIKKAENGSNYKTKKVEITVSIDGVAIQEPRSNNILHQFPLHKISYCADEKGAKKFFSFIAKTGNGPSSAFPNGEILSSSSNNSNGIQNGTTNGNVNGSNTEEGHECFVFISNKLASDITLTIGQAFDLAYKRYVNDNGKTMEMSKLQSQNRQLENTVTAYRQRLREMSEIVSKNDLERLLVRLGLRDILEVPQENGTDGQSTGINGSKTPDLGIDVSTPSNDDQLLIETSPKHFAPIVPPRNMQNPLSSTLEALKPSVGTKLEGLLLNSDSDSDFDPRAEETDTIHNGNKQITNDLFGYEPPKQSPGQQLFTNNLLSNGFSNGITTNGLSSPPPLLAPPPKAATPRRNTPGSNNNSSLASQDLFGSTPFSIQPTPVFDAPTFHISLDEISSAFIPIKPEPKSPVETTVMQDLSTLTNISDQFNIILSHSPVFPNMNTITHSVSNPFLRDLVPESTENTMGSNFLGIERLPHASSSPSKYDAFKGFNNESPFISSNDTEPFVMKDPSTSKKEVNPDLFKDFAVSAFNEFKRESQRTTTKLC